MNPFKKRTGVLPSYFTGRNNELNELKEIFESTREGDPGHVIIFGPRGIGKTCLLLKFQEELKNFENTYVVRIPLVEGSYQNSKNFDCIQILRIFDGFEDIYGLIVGKCSDALEINLGDFWDTIKGLGVNVPLIGGFTISRDIPPTAPSIAIEKILKTIYNDLKGGNPVLVLLFDDLQRIIAYESTQRVLSIIQNALVELNLQGLKIMFVATGSQDIFSEIRVHTDSAVRIFDPYELKPLSIKEVKDAINVPSEKKGITFSKSVIERIYQASEGNPYYMQVIAHNCFKNATNNKVSINEFEKAFPDALNFLAQREFRSMYEKASKEEKRILCFMAENDSNVLSYKEIKEKLNLKSEPSRYLQSMIGKDLILKVSRGKYKLRDTMFKEYLRTASLE